MKRYIYLTALIALTSSVFYGCDKKKSTGDDSIPAISVSKAIEDSVVVYNTYPGTLKANNTVQLVGRVDGYLRSQHFTDGQLVEKGQLLFTIEDSQYRDQVRQAEAALSSAISTRNYASQQYNAMQKALKSDAVSVMEVNQAKSNLEKAEAAIRTARAELETARTQLSYCTIRAPYRGHVTAPTMSVGSYVSGAGAPVVLATLYEDATLYAEFFIDDKSLQQIILSKDRKGINLDSIPLRFQQDVSGKYTAHLTYISPDVDPSTGTLSMRASVDNPDGTLHDGMYVSIDLPSESYPDAVLVKDASIASDQLGKYLYTVSDSDKVVYTPIQIGSEVLDSMRIVKSGIKAGSRYVDKALLKVREGMRIRPVEEK